MSQSSSDSSDILATSRKTSEEKRPCFAELTLDCLGLNENIYTLSILLQTHEKRKGTEAEKPLELVTPYSFCYPGEDPSSQLLLFESCVTYLLKCLGKYVKSPNSPEQLNEILGQFCEELGVDGLNRISDLREGYGEIQCKVLYVLLRQVVEAKGIPRDPVMLEASVSSSLGAPGDLEDFAEHCRGCPEEVVGDSFQMGTVGDIEVTAPLFGPFSHEVDDQVRIRSPDDAVQMPGVSEALLACRLKHHVCSCVKSVEEHRLNPEGACFGEERAWRVHLEETRKYKELFDEYFVPVEEALQNQQGEIQAMLTRVDEKEKWLQRQFHEKVEEHANLRTALDRQATLYSELLEKKKSVAATLETTQQQLQQNVKLLEQKYSKVTNTQPLEALMSTLKTLKEEIKQMDVRIGVLMHASLRAAVRVRSVQSRRNICCEGAKDEAEDPL